MNTITYPLKTSFKINEDEGNVPEQIQNRVNSESWYTHCKGYPNIKEEDIEKK